MKRSITQILIFLLLPINSYSQEKDSILYNLQDYFNKEDYQQTIIYSKKRLNKFSKENLAEANYLIGKSYENLNKEDSAYIYYQKSKKGFKSQNRIEKVTKLNFAIYYLLDSQNKLEIDKDIYFNEVLDYAQRTNSNKWLAIVNNSLGIRNFNIDANTSKEYFFKSYRLYIKLKDKNMEATLLSNLGLLYALKIKKPDSSIYYLNKAVLLFDSDSIKSNTKFNTYNNFGVSYKNNKKYKKAIEYFKIAETLSLKKYNLKNKKILYSNVNACYYYLNDWENAYDYLYKYDSIKDLINLKDQNSQITDIKEQYDNEKLRSNNLESETKRLESEAKQKKNKNIAIGLGGSLALGSIIAFLLFKNTKRKQLIAEQEKALETQKLTTLLKEQELTSIDAMIEGQEKERQRIANDLHDDLGGLMATVKLHFNALKDKNSPELFDKTNQLIDEAYNKVRTVAHAKNSGVIAKQGLLIAVQNMAEKISDSNKIAIDVVDYGLENRLENSLELTIFRIIQELITNVIKHAEAKEATIHITNHDDSLNIMIEDNGKGFNPSQVTKNNKGMGISSIDKRVEHLNGNMTIESEHNKGTTIIIDIPI